MRASTDEIKGRRRSGDGLSYSTVPSPGLMSQPGAAKVLLLQRVADAMALHLASLGDRRAIGLLLPLVVLAILGLGLHGAIRLQLRNVRRRDHCAVPGRRNQAEPGELASSPGI